MQESIPQLFERKFKIYKANKQGSGSALQFDFNEKKKSVFVESAKQNGEQNFDWSNKLTFKLGTSDIAKLLIVLQGKSQKIDLFHDPSKGGYESDKRNSTLAFSKMERGYYFKLSTQSQGGQVSNVGISISDDEAVILKILLQKSVEKIYGW
ncbi:hypothetical protein HY571_02720 [Candidatus Micrarchaeota archaeon]|nr:hypothetical protein [Candidatus Micrarchaeota archaeon]